MWTRAWYTRHVLWRVAIVLFVSGYLSLPARWHAVASEPMPTPPGAMSTGNASGETAMPFDQSLDSVSQVFLQLLAILQTQGVDAARQYASDQGLLTKLDEIRVTLALDTDDATTVDETAIAIGRIGGRVTAAFDDTIEIVIPVQTIVDSLGQATQGITGSSSFFQSLADVPHVKSIRRTPLAHPAAMSNGEE